MTIQELIASLPKAELHIHIEGSLEPKMMWDLAQKHGVELAYKSVDEITQAYDFDNLQSFLDLYYQGANVLRDEDDFYQLMYAYLLHCKQDNVVHTEIMFDPQTHTSRGIPFNVFMQGFKRAIAQAEQELGISVLLIMSFLRHLSENEALQTLSDAAPFYADIAVIGLDSSELGNPPVKFAQAFSKAHALGFKLVAHAGEEGPADYVWQALKELKVDRIDHGVRSIEDPDLVKELVRKQIPLTVCPLSNLSLKVVDDMRQHNILELLELGLLVTVNADDPSYFGGYLNDNYNALLQALDMQKPQLISLVKNSFKASFLPNDTKLKWLKEIDRLVSL